MTILKKTEIIYNDVKYCITADYKLILELGVFRII